MDRSTGGPGPRGRSPVRPRPARRRRLRPMDQKRLTRELRIEWLESLAASSTTAEHRRQDPKPRRHGRGAGPALRAELFERSGFGHVCQLERGFELAGLRLVWAAASARCLRRVGSTVRATARWRNAAAAPTPPRAWARPADPSSSDATSSFGPVVAAARCQARRSDRRWRPSPRPVRLRQPTVVGGGFAVHNRTHQRVRNRSWAPMPRRPDEIAGLAASAGIPDALPRPARGWVPDRLCCRYEE